MMSDSIGVCSQKALEWKQLLSDGKDPQSVGDHPSAEERQKDFQLYLNLYITNTAEDSAISWQSEYKLKMPKDSLVGTTASRQITPQSSTNRRKHKECLIKNKKLHSDFAHLLFMITVFNTSSISEQLQMLASNTLKSDH